MSPEDKKKRRKERRKLRRARQQQMGQTPARKERKMKKVKDTNFNFEADNPCDAFPRGEHDKNQDYNDKRSVQSTAVLVPTTITLKTGPKKEDVDTEVYNITCFGKWFKESREMTLEFFVRRSQFKAVIEGKDATAPIINLGGEAKGKLISVPHGAGLEITRDQLLITGNLPKYCQEDLDEGVCTGFNILIRRLDHPTQTHEHEWEMSTFVRKEDPFTAVKLFKCKTCGAEYQETDCTGRKVFFPPTLGCTA